MQLAVQTYTNPIEEYINNIYSYLHAIKAKHTEKKIITAIYKAVIHTFDTIQSATDVCHFLVSILDENQLDELYKLLNELDVSRLYKKIEKLSDKLTANQQKQLLSKYNTCKESLDNLVEDIQIIINTDNKDTFKKISQGNLSDFIAA